MTSTSRGVAILDVGDSVANWSAHEQPKVPEGAPNVAYIGLDDVGSAL
ncbi:MULTISPECIES: hypothetical protein [unclassified Streptomyces]|uniref:Uncharacterized protein n=1 Tax=Streptomyces sp. NBC_00119 TaxID=2975659 RepID=A0AAU1TXH8_9ACTN|nr:MULTISPECIES: hypothetical protein [unclassified Streptomyces]MCX4648366.1 hypothetical protein [Streptomyces sp. NBC_01446]MCX5323517.1 hypothetical protein [Streptomyces sp. NBC_00120]